MASAFADTAGENTVLKPADVVELFTEMNIECNEDDAKEILLLLGQYTDGEVGG